MHQNDSFKPIWDKARPLLIKCRWWDLWHTDMSAGFLEEIVQAEHIEDSLNILMPAIILHDIGWSQLSEEKNSNWDAREMRIMHMEVGAKIGAKILKEIGYEPILIEKIVGLIRVHDNGYLGIEPRSDMERVIRDADACFILTELSFWKDFNAYSEINGEHITPSQLLDKRIKNNSKRYYNKAQEITNKQIRERMAEIEDTFITPLQRFESLKSESLRNSSI